MKHYKNTCPRCGKVEECECPGSKKETNNLCIDCWIKDCWIMKNSND
jgi:hypothetical protein